MLDVARAIEQHTDLATNLRRQFGHGPSEVIGDQAVLFQPPPAEPFESLGLARLETGGVAVDLNGVLPRKSMDRMDRCIGMCPSGECEAVWIRRER